MATSHRITVYNLFEFIFLWTHQSHAIHKARLAFLVNMNFSSMFSAIFPCQIITPLFLFLIGEASEHVKTSVKTWNRSPKEKSTTLRARNYNMQCLSNPISPMRGSIPQGTVAHTGRHERWGDSTDIKRSIKFRVNPKKRCSIPSR